MLLISIITLGVIFLPKEKSEITCDMFIREGSNEWPLKRQKLQHNKEPMSEMVGIFIQSVPKCNYMNYDYDNINCVIIFKNIIQ
jgi:hypothetical protein